MKRVTSRRRATILAKPPILVQSENIAKSVVLVDNTARYGNAMLVECDLKPNTTYTIIIYARYSTQFYFNENVFVDSAYKTFAVGMNKFTLTTKNEIDKTQPAQYTNGSGWRVLKNARNQTHSSIDNLYNIALSDKPITNYTPYFPPYYLYRGWKKVPVEG